MEIALCHPASEALRYSRSLGCRRGYIDFSWDMIQPHKDVFDFSYYDPIVDAAREAGLELAASIYSQRGFDYFPDGCYIWHNHRGMMPDPGAWQHYLRAVVARYGDIVRYWEIWSEPNCKACNPMSYYDPGLYFDVLKLGSTTIRDVDSSAKVILGGIWPYSLSAGYFETLIDKGAADYFDILSWHFFLMAQNKNALDFSLWKPSLSKWVDYFRSLISQDYPMWMMEFGLPTKAPESEYLYTRTRGQIVGLSEAGQADWFSQFAEAADREWGIGTLVWLMLSDVENPDFHYIKTTGMLRVDGSEKPVRQRIADFQAATVAKDPEFSSSAGVR